MNRRLQFMSTKEILLNFVPLSFFGLRDFLSDNHIKFCSKNTGMWHNKFDVTSIATSQELILEQKVDFILGDHADFVT